MRLFSFQWDCQLLVKHVNDFLRTILQHHIVLLKHAKQDSSGVAPLKSDGRTLSDDCEKSNALNRQFPQIPERLSSLAQRKVQELNDQGCNLPFQSSPYSQMQTRVRLFADDTAIYLAISSEGEQITLQNDLHILEIWEKRCDMSFNRPNVRLYISQEPIQTRYILHGTVLDSVPSAKYLGVTISDNLSWTPTLIQSPRKQTTH